MYLVGFGSTGLFIYCGCVDQMVAMETKVSIQPSNYLLPPNMLSITFICLNVSNYAQWAQTVEVFLLGRKKFDYIISGPPTSTDSKYAD